MKKLHLKFLENYNHILIDSDPITIFNLSKIMGYQIPNFHFIKMQYKRKYGREMAWDGFTSYITRKNHAPYGSIGFIEQYCKDNNISFSKDKELENVYDEELYEKVLNDEYSINGETVELREAQKNVFHTAVIMGNCSIISPTSSGKTLSMYLICKYHLALGNKILIIVPQISLVSQGLSDFYSYGYNGKINGIKAGEDRVPSDITFSTFQTLTKIPELTNNYQVLIVDELHRIKSKSIIDIIKKSSTLKYTIGLTGTLKEDSEERMIASCFIGMPLQMTTTKELMDKKIVAKLNVEVVRLLYNKQERENKPNSYIAEKHFFNRHVLRNDKIIQLAKELNKTGIIAVNEIEHCQYLFDRARQLFPELNIYQIRGNHNQRNDVMCKTLDELKPLIEKEQNAILIVGLKVFSTGISLKNINFGIMATSTKSYITVIQTIGRGLRVNEVKKDFVFIDILDDLRLDEFDETYSFAHYTERLKYYKEQNFTVNKHSITLGYPVPDCYNYFH